jgi:hypothetical protein
MQKAEIKCICSDGGTELAEYVVVTLIFPKVALLSLVLLAKRWRFHYEKDWESQINYE